MNISFVYPAFLTALAVIAIPVIIHLFNFRRFKKVYFTNVRFLKELKEETTSRSRLKHLLVLAARILALSFLVMAFAQPFIPAVEGGRMAANKVTALFIDNSFSMEAVTRDGTLLEVAKRRARELVSSFRPSDRFVMVTNDFDPSHQRMVNREEMLELIESVRVSPASRKLSEIHSRVAETLSSSGTDTESSLIVLSDFQERMADVEVMPEESPFRVFLAPLKAAETSNLFIDSCYFTTPVLQLKQTAELKVRIRNSGTLDANAVPVKLLINGAQRAVAAADVPAMNYTEVTLSFTAASQGWQKAEVTITDHPVIFDDRYYLSFPVKDRSDVLVINRNSLSPWYEALFQSGGFFHLTTTSDRQIDYGSLSAYQCIFVEGLSEIPSGLATELKKYVDNGGTLALIPDSSIDFNSYSQFLNTLQIASFSGVFMNNERITALNLDDPIFKGVFSSRNAITDQTDLPSSIGYFVRSAGSGSAGESLLRYRSGATALARHHSGKGQVYLFCFPYQVTWTNFTRHALFVPVTYGIALSSGTSMPPAYTIGSDEQIELPFISLTGDQVLHLQNNELDFDVIPAHRNTGNATLIRLNNQITLANHYELTKGNQPVTVLSFNFNRDESVMRFRDSENFEKNYLEFLDGASENLAGSFVQLNEGTPLWKYCIVLALFFLAIEILLLKFWKK